jgi:hypothetical protein
MAQMLRSKKAILVTIMNQSHLAKSEFEEDTVTAGDTSNASRSRDKIWSTTQNLWSFGSWPSEHLKDFCKGIISFNNVSLLRIVLFVVCRLILQETTHFK